MKENKFGKASMSRVSTTQKPVQWIAKRCIVLLGFYHGIDAGCPRLGGFRTPDEQFLLYQEGKSRLDGTNMKSYHQSGWAIDLFAYYDKKAQWDMPSLKKIHECMKEATDEWNALYSEAAGYALEYEWGGNWTSPVDGPHHQWKKVYL